MPNELPEVDEQFLAKCLGYAEWPERCKMQDRMQRTAARVITDAHRATTPETTLTNAVAWVKDIYEQGKRVGCEEERCRWEQMVCSIFGIRP